MPYGKDLFTRGDWLYFMKNTSKKTSSRIKIVSATATAIFSLASAFAGTYAWFAGNQSVEGTGMLVKIKETGNAFLQSINLIKFNYASDNIGNLQITDYLDPSRGQVNSYYYNSEEKSYGYDEDENFVSVDETMNIYDPLDRIIRGGDLISLNCNAIYEVSFLVSSGDTYINLYSELLSDTPELGINQILLSDCADFDVYFEEDLSLIQDTYSNESTYSVGDIVFYNGSLHQCNTAINSAEDFNSTKWDIVDIYSNSSSYSVGEISIYDGKVYKCKSSASSESFNTRKWDPLVSYSNELTYSVGDIVFYGGHIYQCKEKIETAENFVAAKWETKICNKLFYPSYKDTNFNTVDDVYYKISYLSSLAPSHSNFYESETKDRLININSNRFLHVANDNTVVTIYINVNYSPEQADSFTDESYTQVTALYDFIFDVHFTDTPEEAS